MKRFRLVWPDDLTTTYRNTVVEDPRPTEIIADDFNYTSIANSFVSINFVIDDVQKYTFYEKPIFIEDLGEV